MPTRDPLDGRRRKHAQLSFDPGRLVMMSRSVVGLPLVAGTLKSKKVLTSRPRSNFPCSTSCIMLVHVKSLEMEPRRNKVFSGETGTFFSKPE